MDIHPHTGAGVPLICIPSSTQTSYMLEQIFPACLLYCCMQQGYRLLQIAGGHPFKPPQQDVNAPDLYIPLMALCTYCILGSIAMVSTARWTSDSMYALVSDEPRGLCFGLLLLPGARSPSKCLLW